MITITYEGGGALKTLELLADSFAELQPVFRRFTKYMREQVNEVFDTDGHGEWAQRSEHTAQADQSGKALAVAKVESSKYGSLLGALRQSQRRTQRLLAKTPASNSKLTEKRRAAIARYEDQVSEVTRHRSGRCTL